MPLSPGTRLGPYEITAPIGAGGMGEVYRATDTRLGRIVAVKVLSGPHSERFEREARAIAALNHPNICTLHDVGPDYLVMEFVEGSPLRGPLPVEQAVPLAVQIAAALEAAHGKGIVHRDLKPGNILVTRDGVKLLDFGLAKVAEKPDSDDTTMTQAGAILGTAAYMSPEQAEGKPVDARSDIFAFGLVLYELLSGKKAFEGPNAMAVIGAILHKDPKPLQAPPALERIVMRCLVKNPAQRFQTMTEVREALSGPASGSISRQFGDIAPMEASIAVLPFANMSRDEDNEYFSDGLSEEIINLLTRISGLKVIARTSAFAFKGRNEDVRKVAEALGVTSVLEGSVRKAGNRIRVAAQLINASDGSHLWSDRYDREITDVFDMQDEISTAIAGALQLKLSPQSAAGPRHTPNVDAYEAYLKGLHHMFKVTPDALTKSQEFLERAIALDPEFALPHSALGGLYYVLAFTGLRAAHEVMPMARVSQQRALELDPSLPEAHSTYGLIAAAFDYDWAEAERRFRLARAKHPIPVVVRWQYSSFYLLPFDRAREAADEMEQALEQDPLNAVYRNILGNFLHAAGLHERGTEQIRKGLEIDETYWGFHLTLAQTYFSDGRITEALAAAERAFQLAPWNSAVTGMLAGLLAATGEALRSGKLAEHLKQAPLHWSVTGMVVYHLLRGDIEQAADWMEKAIEVRQPSLIPFLRNPMLRSFRSSARWARIVKMLNLPESQSVGS